MLLQKIKYGFTRLRDELVGNEDYWHCRERALSSEELTDTVYFLDMSRKGVYPGEMVDGIPIFYLDGKYRSVFYITIFNYGLGLLNRLLNGEDVSNAIQKVIKFTIETQSNDGSWISKFQEGAKHELIGGKTSGMTQGLGISFLTRCFKIGYIKKKMCLTCIEKAKNAMLSNQCVSFFGEIKFIEEFCTPGNSIMNGSVFALLGLYDYCKFIDDMSLFHNYITDFEITLPKFNFMNWCYYDLKGTVCSKFYQQLHVDLMWVLYQVTNNEIFKKYAIRWEKGLNLFLIFVFIKAIQKMRNIKTMGMNYASN